MTIDLDGAQRWNLDDLDALRERRDELLLAVEKTVAMLKVEQLEAEPDLAWMRRAQSFVYRGKAALYSLDQQDRDQRRQEHNQAMAAGIKKEASRQSALGQARHAHAKARGLADQLATARKELTQAQHLLGNATRERDAARRKQQRAQGAAQRMNAELKALRSHLGAEGFDRVVGPVRAALEASQEDAATA